MPTLYILCGPSGCGKTTWARNFIKEHRDIRYVSRDEIRFELVDPNESYFRAKRKSFGALLIPFGTLLLMALIVSPMPLI